MHYPTTSRMQKKSRHSEIRTQTGNACAIDSECLSLFFLSVLLLPRGWPIPKPRSATSWVRFPVAFGSKLYGSVEQNRKYSSHTHTCIHTKGVFRGKEWDGRCSDLSGKKWDHPSLMAKKGKNCSTGSPGGWTRATRRRPWPSAKFLPSELKMWWKLRKKPEKLRKISKCDPTTVCKIEHGQSSAEEEKILIFNPSQAECHTKRPRGKSFEGSKEKGEGENPAKKNAVKISHCCWLAGSQRCVTSI